jgi:probable rRNA maturation factor
MIRFHSEVSPFNVTKKAQLKKWVAEIIVNAPLPKHSPRKSKRKVGDISFVFCSDVFLLEMNKTYLKHDTLTDIITFDYSKEDEEQPISGDIFISIDRVLENAEKFDKSFENELHRIIIHGALHLIGYKDKTKTTKEEMTQQEDRCLKALKKFDLP